MPKVTSKALPHPRQPFDHLIRRERYVKQIRDSLSDVSSRDSWRWRYYHKRLRQFQGSGSDLSSRASTRESRTRSYKESFSDICGRDEIDDLLAEIQELDPVSIPIEDFQDFEIDGSNAQGIDVLDDQWGSMLSVRSWDSHANYHHQIDDSDQENPVFTGVIMYCDASHLKTPVGALRLILLNTWSFLTVSLLYIVMSSVIVHVVHVYQTSYPTVPRYTRDQLIAVAVLGYWCGLVACAISFLTVCVHPTYRIPIIIEESEYNLQDHMSPDQHMSPHLTASTPLEQMQLLDQPGTSTRHGHSYA